MQSKITPQPHTTSLPTRISFILFVLAVVIYAIGIISREFSGSTVGQNALINRFSVFDDGLNYDAISSKTTDTNGMMGAAQPGFAWNNDTAFYSTAVSRQSTAVALVATIRIKNNYIFDPGLLRSQQPIFVLNNYNIDNGRHEFGVLKDVSFMIELELIGINIIYLNIILMKTAAQWH